MSISPSQLFLAFLLVTCGACSAPEEAPAPPAPPPRDPELVARSERTRTWCEQHAAGCVADALEVEMPADLREHCTFDTRGKLYARTDSRRVRELPNGERELVLETTLEATTPNLMAARVLLGKVEVAALRKLRVTFAESAGAIGIRGTGNAVWWIDDPAQRERGASLRLLLPPRGSGAP
jgi:hypothetical protein